MHIILGGTGHVGSELSLALIEKGEQVMVVTHDPAKSKDWQRKGAEIAVADVRDTEELHRVFSQGKRLFLLNPNADPSTDTDIEERKNLKSILAAIEGSGLEKIVAESTYGAQPVDRAGDLGILYEMEQGLKAQPIPVSIQRAAYYMSNWDASLETARKDGVIRTFFPADLTLPMVAPHDLGQAAARWMTESVESTGLHYVEGPERYTPADVAEAFAAVLKKPVEVETIPRENWIETYTTMGFSEASASSYAKMTSMTLDGPLMPDAPVRGSTTLRTYVAKLVRENESARAQTLPDYCY